MRRRKFVENVCLCAVLGAFLAPFWRRHRHSCAVAMSAHQSAPALANSLPALGHAAAAAIVLLACLLSAVLLRQAMAAKPGPMRAALVAPSVFLNIAVAHAVMDSKKHSYVLAGTTALILSFLMPMKAVGLAMNRGPLAGTEGATFTQFFLVYVLPINAFVPTATNQKPERAVSAHALVQSALAHLVLLAALVTALQGYRDRMHLLVKDFLNGLSLHCFLAVTLDLHGVVGIHFFGLACERHHHYPFLARSVASFWTRWNLVVGSILRAVVYEPIAEGKLIAAGSGSDGKLRPWRIWGVDSRDLGATASFLASALMHEWAFWFLTGGIYGGIFSPELRWFWFFILQAPVIVIERIARGFAYRAGVPKDSWLWWVPTCAVLLAMGSRLFVEPAERVGLANQVLSEINSVIWATGGAISAAAERVLAYRPSSLLAM